MTSKAAFLEDGQLAENVAPNVREEGDDTRNHHRRTSRVQLACAPCRLSKMKCDRRIPVCEQCYKRSREGSRKYSEKGLRYLSASKKTGALKEKMERLETFVHRLQGSLPTPEDLPGDGAPKRLGGGLVGENMMSQMGKLRLYQNGSTQWVEPFHWESIIDDIADVKDYLELENDLDTPEAEGDRQLTDWNIPEVDVLLGFPHILSLQDLLKLLPSKPDMDRYVATWFNVMEPSRVIVHAPTFQQQYQSFWHNPREVQPAWLALLLVSSSLGAEISSQVSNDTRTQARAELLSRLAAHALVRADTAKPQPHIIEALILYSTSLLFKYHDATSRIWQVLGLVIRLCYQAGYHRDPGRNPKFSEFDCEMRRRVWMVAHELEISVSCCVGRVSTVNSRLCDAAPPSNLLDTDFSPTHYSPPRLSEECTLVQVEISFSRLVSVMGDIAISSHSVVPPSKAEVCTMHERLTDARNALPRKLKMVPLDQSLVDSPTEVIDRLRLEFVYQRSLCMLYHRFLGNSKADQEHASCILAAETIVKHSVSMLEAAQPGGQLAALKIMLVRHIHDFNLAAMILCSELNRSSRPPGNEVRRSAMDPAMRSLLLRACYLWNAPNLPSPKAKVALQAMVTFLEATPTQTTQVEKRTSDVGIAVEEVVPTEFSIDSFGLYDNITISEIAAEGYPDVTFDGLDSVFSSLFE